MKKTETPDWNLSGLRPATIAALEANEPVYFGSDEVVDRMNGMTFGDVVKSWVEPVPRDWIAERLTEQQRENLFALDDPNLTPAQRKDRDYFRAGGAVRFTTLREMSGKEESLDDLKRQLSEALESQRHSDDLASWAGARASGDMLNANEGADRPRRVLISKIDYSRRIQVLKERISRLEAQGV